MARPREFNEDEALDRAMEVFWKKGYKNTSLDDLLEGMRIQRGSFYNTFGSKRATYLRALRRYTEVMHTQGPYAAVAGAEPGVDTLQKMLEIYLTNVIDGDGTHGCLFNHASKEHRGEDAEVQAILMDGVARARQTIRQGIEAAQERGQLPPEMNAESTALLFMGVAWGLHALAEAGVQKPDLLAAATQLFAMSQHPV